MSKKNAIVPRKEIQKVKVKRKEGGRYFDAPPQVPCFPSGCRLLDRVLGGGWAVGRIGNIVGDKSTGKTLLAIEACANFAIIYPKGLIRYRETEAAFDENYAETVGLPLDRVDFCSKREVETVEDFYADLEEFISLCQKKKQKGLYILDSLDAIGDSAEMDAAFGKDSYGGKKPKLMGQLFRRLVRKVERAGVTVLIISQVRDKIGVMFGEKHTRSGGRALDFYASQIIWLSNMGKIKVKKKGVERSIGVDIKVQCKKNKVGLAFRDCQFPILFAYGVDDFDACLTWLNEVKMLDRVGLSDDEEADKFLKALDEMEPGEIREEREKLNLVIDAAWWEIEKQFLPVRKKYA